MGTGGVQYKPKDSKLATSPQKPSRCMFKNLLFGLMALFSLSVVALMTWIISKSSYQVKASDTPVNDVISSSYLLSKIDVSVDPCDDFYQYSCGSWVQSQWKDDVSVIDKENARYEERIKKYLAEDILDSDLVSYKNVKTMYQACINNGESDLTDNDAWIKRLFDFTTIEDVMNFAAELGYFVFYEVNVEWGPLSMNPVARYAWNIHEDNIEDMIKDLPEDLGQKDNIMKYVETMKSLAQKSNVGTTISEFITRTTCANLTEHFQTFGLKPSDDIQAHPDLIDTTEQFFTDNLADGDELFKFAKTYAGILFQQRYTRLARRERNHMFCYTYFTSSYFGFTVGSLMLARENINYTETLKTVQEMVSIITEEYRQTISESNLLSQEGKSSAIKKLDNIEILLGAAPWIKNDTHLKKLNYDGELNDVMSFLKMYKMVDTFHQKKKIQSILHPPVSDLWEVTMGPQISLNAAYYQDGNAISVPIGAFIPPYFDSRWPLPMKFGALGSIIGHEITHAFDQKGMHYDSKGLQNDLWSSEDAESVKNEQNCLINQYNGFGHQNFNINGTLTLEENFADNGGLTVSYRAYKNADKKGKPFKIHGLDLTSDKLFFLSYAQIRCNNYSMDKLDYEYYDNPGNIYSPPDFRVTGPIKNNRHFSKAFSCSSNSKMIDSSRCRTL
ncbi:neprilysin-like isoform X1 [Bolinopsis microptera]